MTQTCVLLLIEGLGLSAARRGNALLDANTKNLNYLWQNFPHAVLDSRDAAVSAAGFESNPEANFSSIANGALFLPALDYLNQTIKSGLFGSNKMLVKVLSEAENQVAAAHLIGSLSANSHFSEIEHLKNLLKAAKERNLYRTYLHLIIDSSIPDKNSALSILKKIEFIMKEIGIGRLASLCGQKHISVFSHTLLENKARLALSAEQALAQHLSAKMTPAELPPIFLSKEGRPEARLSDFDVLVFFNHNLTNFEEPIAVFAGKSGNWLNKIRRPRMLKLVTLVDTPYLKADNLFNAFPRDHEHSLLNVIKQSGLKQSLHAEGARLPVLFNHLGSLELMEKMMKSISATPYQNYAKEFPRVTLDIFKSVTNVLTRRQSDFILADIRGLDALTLLSSYNDIVHSIEFTDHLIGELTKVVLARESFLIISSPWGKLENLTDVKKNALQKPTSNPVPLILVSQNLKTRFAARENFSLNIMYEILSKHHTLYDIAPTVLDVLHLSKPVSMTGRSLLPHLAFPAPKALNNLNSLV